MLNTPQIAIHRASNSSDNPDPLALENAKARTTSSNQIPGHTSQPNVSFARGSGSGRSPTPSLHRSSGSIGHLGSVQSVVLGHPDFFRRSRDEGIQVHWPMKDLDSAPEVQLLLKKPSHFTGSSSYMTYMTKLLRCFGTVCRGKVADSCGLDNFKPVIARTDNTIAYVSEILRAYSITAKYGTTQKASLSSLGSRASTTTKASVDKSLRRENYEGAGLSAKQTHQKANAKQLLLKELYDRAYASLAILQQCIGHFKNIILSLTFTKYAEEELTESEARITRGRSILGCFIWIVVFALQQLQDDPEVESLESQSKPNPGVRELGIEMQHLLTLSFQAWHELVVAVGVVEKVHKMTEDVFHRQTAHFHSAAAPDSEAAGVATVHIKKYRRGSDKDADDLRNLKTFDPYATLLTWSRSRGLPRILYKWDYTKATSLWYGFDPLTLDRKVGHLRDILNFIRMILESVKETALKITGELQSRNYGSFSNQPGSPHHQPTSTTFSYDEGVDMMDDVLSKKLAHFEWTPEEIHEFFEVDKIFLDTMDCLTVGAGVARAILHDARHMMHICYEASRLLDFRDLATLPPFEKQYRKLRDDFVDQRRKNRRLSTGSASFDIEEIHLELRNVSGLFRTSAHQEILKVLPIYTNRVGITLQDAELVFTPSSEKLLSS